MPFLVFDPVAAVPQRHDADFATADSRYVRAQSQNTMAQHRKKPARSLVFVHRIQKWPLGIVDVISQQRPPLRLDEFLVADDVG
ncbi:hypothetical protein SAMN05421684_6217 [Asanoa ishikariensis]|uniref:Uncharacterized protein n=1 Tax=Asanoa ishikariensis TaxID=137265 RepID=A0A1H3TS77_9ACTN|nr:hypothetical protein SAMN05421684_6217 [Asanoa ishikariensis]